MRIFVNAKPGAKEENIKKIDESHYSVSVKEPPVKGRANYAIIGLLAEYFNVNSSNVKIISGYSSKNKIIEIYGL